MDEVIELEEKQIDSMLKIQNNLIHEFDKITKRIEEMYKEQVQ